jgi:hypothetical protein
VRQSSSSSASIVSSSSPASVRAARRRAVAGERGGSVGRDVHPHDVAVVHAAREQRRREPVLHLVLDEARSGAPNTGS